MVSCEEAKMLNPLLPQMEMKIDIDDSGPFDPFDVTCVFLGNFILIVSLLMQRWPTLRSNLTLNIFLESIKIIHPNLHLSQMPDLSSKILNGISSLFSEWINKFSVESLYACF